MKKSNINPFKLFSSKLFWFSLFISTLVIIKLNENLSLFVELMSFLILISMFSLLVFTLLIYIAAIKRIKNEFIDPYKGISKFLGVFMIIILTYLFILAIAWLVLMVIFSFYSSFFVNQLHSHSLF